MKVLQGVIKLQDSSSAAILPYLGWNEDLFSASKVKNVDETFHLPLETLGINEGREGKLTLLYYYFTITIRCYVAAHCKSAY